MKIKLISIITVLLSSCISSPVMRQAIPDSYLKLSKHSQAISINIVAKNNTFAGFQYLFFIFPFGIVKLKNTDLDLGNTLTAALLRRGYTITPDNAELVTLKLLDYSLNAYDLFFIRRLKAEVKLECSHNSDKNLKHSSKASYSSYERYGFEQQLSIVWAKALDEAVSECLDVIIKNKQPAFLEK